MGTQVIVDRDAVRRFAAEIDYDCTVEISDDGAYLILTHGTGEVSECVGMPDAVAEIRAMART